MSGTTSKGIVYPTNTDNIDFAADMQILAESVNNNFLRLSGETLTGAITANSGMNKGYRLNNEAGSVDARLWSNYVSGSTWRVAAVNDAASTGTDFLTLDRANSKITTGVPVALKPQAFRMEASTGSIPASPGTSWYDFTFWDTIAYDDAGGCSLANDTYTIPTSGLWTFHSYFGFNNAAKLGIALKSQILINGTARFENISEGNTDSTTAVSRKSTSLLWTSKLNSGDVVKIQWSFGNDATAQAWEVTTARKPFFSGYMVSAA